MKFLFLGGGAIGCYVGGALALAGQQVGFVERGENVAALRTAGISLTRENHTQLTHEFKVFDGPAVALEHDWDVIVAALKSFDTGTAMDQLLAVTTKLPPVLSLQNGVDNEPLIAEKLGINHVIYGTVTSAISKSGVGKVTEETVRGIGIDTNHSLGNQIVTAFNQAGLHPRSYTFPAAMKWSKLLTNLQGNATSAIFDLTPAQLFADKTIYDIEIRMMRECISVMKAQDLHVIDLPGTPTRALAWAIGLPKFISQPILRKALGGSRGEKMPSFHIDLHAGRRDSEVVFLNGAVVRHGKELGIPTPVNNALTTTLTQLANGELPLDTYRHNPKKWVREWL